MAGSAVIPPPVNRAVADRVSRGLCPGEPLAYFPNARYSHRTEPGWHPASVGEVPCP